MVYDYLITIKKPDSGFPDLVSQLMYILALLAFGYFYYNYPKSGTLYLVVAVLIIACWAYALIKKRKTGQALFRLGLLFAAAGWLTGPERNTWMGLLYGLAAIIEKQVKFPLEVGFAQKEVSLNTLPKKVLHWNEINNAVIKDGFLTIDQKNNKLFQKEIEGDVSADIETEFNEFCRHQIAASGVKE
jgi:hypothetical protein